MKYEQQTVTLIYQPLLCFYLALLISFNVLKIGPEIEPTKLLGHYSSGSIGLTNIKLTKKLDGYQPIQS